MLNKFSLKNVSLIIFLLISCSCSNLETRKENISTEIKYTDVCEVTKNSSLYDNKVVRVKGKIKGFHQIILYSDSCPDEKNIILLDISYSFFQKFFEESKNANQITRKTNDVTGEIFLQGKFEQDTGKIFNYGELISNMQTGEIIKKPKDLIVSRIIGVQVDNFIPE